MSASDRSPLDLRHPAWCSPRRCGVNQERGFGDHRSEVVPIERVELYDTFTTVWLSQHIFEPLHEANVWLHVRMESRGTDGEIDELHTEDLRLEQAERIGSVMVLMARRGLERRYVAEEVWRASGGAPDETPRQPGPGEAGNSGPGFGPLPGDLS